MSVPLVFPSNREQVRTNKRWAAHMVTYNAAKAMGIKDYGLDIGCRADIVIHEAENIKETLRMRLERPYVIKGGRIIAENGVVRRHKPD